MLNFLDTNLESFGLHISDNSIKVAKIKKTKKELLLVSFGSKKIKDGIIKNGLIKEKNLLVEEIKELIENVKGNSLKDRYVALSLFEEKSFYQVIDMPEMSEKDLEKAIKYEAENYIPLPIDEVYLDFEILKTEKSKVLISAIPKEVVDLEILVAKKANLFPVAMEVESTSIVRSVIKKSETDKSILLVNIGESKTIVTVFCNGSIRFSSCLSSSLNSFAQKIAINKNIPILDAEVLMRDYGLLGAGKGREIYQLLKPSILEIVETIKNYLSYHHYYGVDLKETTDQKEIGKVIISGGGIKIKGLVDFFSNNIDIPIEKGSPFSNISEKSRKIFDNSSDYEVAFGLALRNFEID